MKLKAIIGCVLVVAMLIVASPVLALSLGVSPTHIELEVTGDGSTTTSVDIYYFNGDVDISLVDIPLSVEPSTIHVDASDGPVTVELTIYGNHSLDTQVYDGYIRFIAVSGGAATGGVQVIAKVTNIADGIAPVVETSVEPTDEVVTIEETPPQESVSEEAQPEEAPVTEQAPSETQATIEKTPAPESPAPEQPSTPSESNPFPVLPVAGIAAGAAIIITLIVVVARRYQY